MVLARELWAEGFSYGGMKKVLEGCYESLELILAKLFRSALSW